MISARTYVRQQVSIAAKILAPDLSSCVDCEIKDVSAGGTLVHLPDGSPIPDRVYIWREESEAILECRVQWRKINLVGLSFVAPESAAVRTLIKTCAPAKRPATAPRLRKSA
jgi:PilZ domain